MPRPRRCRRVRFEPNINYFKPAGVRVINLQESILTVSEYEAIRLKDLLGLDQETAAKKMDISQPTFHRLILSARNKIADAIVNGKAIKIHGGVYKMPGGDRTGPEGRGPRTGRGGGFGAGMGRGAGRGMGFGGPATTCTCPKCGYEEAKVRGQPCVNTKCPKCGTMMVRGR